MEIFGLLDISPVVQSYKIIDYKAWSTGSYIKMTIMISNGSVLHVREYNDERERHYSFHWQDPQSVLLMRWDNAPHHSHLSTFPHHKHHYQSVEESTDISLEEVLQHIEARLHSGGAPS